MENKDVNVNHLQVKENAYRAQNQLQIQKILTQSTFSNLTNHLKIVAFNRVVVHVARGSEQRKSR